MNKCYNCLKNDFTDSCACSQRCSELRKKYKPEELKKHAEKFKQEFGGNSEKTFCDYLEELEKVPESAEETAKKAVPEQPVSTGNSSSLISRSNQVDDYFSDLIDTSGSHGGKQPGE